MTLKEQKIINKESNHEVKGKCCVCLAPGHLKLKCKVEKQCFHCKGKTVAIEVYVQIFSN